MRIILLASLLTVNTFSLKAEALCVLCLGDSLTEGYGLSDDRAYPSILQQTLNINGFEHIKVINAGVSGATTASGLGRLKWALKARSKPNILFLALGANDGLRGLEVQNSKDNLRKIIRVAKQHQIKVILAGMKMPPNYGKAYTERFEGLFAELANEEEILFIPFLLKGVAARPDLNLTDGIHPNEKGQVKISETIYPFILKAIESDS